MKKHLLRIKVLSADQYLVQGRLITDKPPVVNAGSSVQLLTKDLPAIPATGAILCVWCHYTANNKLSVEQILDDGPNIDLMQNFYYDACRISEAITEWRYRVISHGNFDNIGSLEWAFHEYPNYQFQLDMSGSIPWLSPQIFFMCDLAFPLFKGFKNKQNMGGFPAGSFEQRILSFGDDEHTQAFHLPVTPEVMARLSHINDDDKINGVVRINESLYRFEYSCDFEVDAYAVGFIGDYLNDFVGCKVPVMRFSRIKNKEYMNLLSRVDAYHSIPNEDPLI